MPEIKNTFLKGRMNKDLDERLIASGEYRDAMNVQVTTSDGSDVGAVQNILGNVKLNSNTDKANLIGTGWKCVGAVADEKNNNLYWFLYRNSRKVILEYSITTNEVIPVFIDLNNDTLGFTGKIITGINIIDNLLFWTDNNSEPRKINIDRSKQGTIKNKLNEHTKLVVNGEVVKDANGDDIDVTEEHITVIKKSPLKAPSFKINTSLNNQEPPIFEKIFPRFSYRYKYVDGEFSAFAPFTNVVFNPKYTENPATPGTNYNIYDAYSPKEPFNTAMVNSISSIELFDFVSPDIPKDVIQIDLLYKKENSNVVYSIASLKPDDLEFSESGYNQDSSFTNSEYKGKYIVNTQNIYAALPANQLLRPWDNVPKKALAQEITGNRIVYGNYTQGYDLLSASDPAAAELIRVEVEADLQLRNINNNFDIKGLPSIKSQRNYQLGIVFGDKYGRETPVLTSSKAAVKTPWNDNVSNIGLTASESTQLAAKLPMFTPFWATYFKFYVKETSGEYYNMVMDSAYLPRKTNEFKNEDDNIWLAFPSSDRNKISEEDYIILKKLINPTNNQQISLPNRFKVISINNEVPDDVKYDYKLLGSVQNTSDNQFNGLFPDSTKSIKQADNDFLEIEKTAQTTAATPVLTGYLNMNSGKNMLLTEGSIYDSDKENVYIYWTVADVNGQGQSSKKYRVTSIKGGAGSSDTYGIKLTESISTEDAALAEPAVGSALAYAENLVINFERKQVKDYESFSGKFFVRVSATPLINSSIIGSNNVSFNFFVVSQQPSFWWVDPGVTNNAGQTTTAPDTLMSSSSGNDEGTATGDNLTNTATEWATLMINQGRSFFIDQMHMVGGVALGMGPLAFEAKTSSLQNWYGNGVDYPWKVFWTGNQLALANLTHLDDIDGSGWAKSYKNQTSTWDIIVQNEEVNGLEGVVNVTSTHQANIGLGNQGNRTWMGNYIGSNHFPYQVYGTSQDPTGRHFIHLSFLGPGDDLHNGNWGTFTNANAVIGNFIDPGNNNGLAGHLQGIHGGGIFNTADFSKFGSGNDKFQILETEGSYVTPASSADVTSTNAYTNAQSDSSLEDLGISQFDPGVNLQNFSTPIPYSGFDANYIDLNENQWHPWYNNGVIDDNVKAFCNQIAPTNKFKFAGDGSDTVYEILSVNKFGLFNHTPWRRRYKYGASGNVEAGDSVEEAAIAWGQTVSDTGTGGDSAKLDILKQKIVDYGKRHNRRVCYVIEVDKDPTLQSFNPVVGGSGNPMDTDTSTNIQFISSDLNVLTDQLVRNPAIWETEAKEDVDLDIYYETNQAYPTRILAETRELFAPVGCTVEFLNLPEARNGSSTITGDVFLKEWGVNAINAVASFELDPGFNSTDANGDIIDYTDKLIRFFRKDGSYTTGKVTAASQNIQPGGGGANKVQFVIDTTIDPGYNEVGLSWFNCFSFGNGIESDRIRDDFNTMTLTNGVLASTTIEEPYEEEVRKHGLIYSGLYNSISGVNNLNQFIMAEKITKDLNPTYGSIQKLFQRRISLVAFCEDRVVGITSNKDALFNADGTPQLISSSAVLGDATPFVGDYGISQNPESFAKESYRAYFTDKQRGAVLRLSMDGITPISDAGMHDFFRDNLKQTDSLIGTYDGNKKDYNLSLLHSDNTLDKTISYSEDIKGWSSFKSFVPEVGETVSTNYYTFKEGILYQHHRELEEDGTTSVDRNTFYGNMVDSHIVPVLNADSSIVKIFNTLNYEGTQSKIDQGVVETVDFYNHETEASDTVDLNTYKDYNLNGKKGWYVDYIKTDIQDGTIQEFIEKEGKWFNYVRGTSGNSNTQDDFAKLGDFNFEGLGVTLQSIYTP